MKVAPAYSYEEIGQKQLPSGTATAWISSEVEDARWDKFLQETPLGQFQQSTIWARVKNVEAWKPVRVVLMLDEEIAGGFQLLWRPFWGGRMGYVSKGPVVSAGHPGLAEFAADLLQQLADREELRGLVVQPPDLCSQMSTRLAANGFELNTVIGISEATWIIDLEGGFEAVKQRMSKWTRKKIRQGANRGVRIREGGREDVKTFFELMLATCRRRGVAPVPADEKTMLALWDAAHSARRIRLTLAEYQGKPLAGLVCILFGQTASFWRKGWTWSDAQLHPNESLMHEMLKWATLQGYRFADFCAFDCEMAAAIQKGTPLSPAQESSRHIFNARLGGSPRFLPKARVYFPNPAIRLAYRTVFHNKIQRASASPDLLLDSPRP